MKGLKKKVGIMSGLAALALVGNAFAVWHFGENVNKSIDGDYYIEKAADAGTIDSVDLTWGKAASLNDGAGPHAVATTDKILILDQPDNGEDRDDVHWAYETTDDATQVACKAQYTYGVEDESKRLNVDLTYSVDFVDAFGNVETDAGLAKYLAITNNTGTWMPNTYITMPTLAYKTGLAPTTIEAYNQMITDLTGSKVRFKFTATAGPASEVELDGIHYTLNEDKTSYTADGYTNELGNVVIPSTVKGLPVTSIGEDAFDGSGMTSIVVPSSVTSIGGYAFMGCPLASMSLPASITSIGETILDSDALTSFDFPGNSVYKTSPDKTLILSADGASIIAAVHGASTYSIPDSVTIIGDWFFANSQTLSSIAIPASVTSIGEGAFANCPALSSVSIPASIASIGSNVFQGCAALSSFDFAGNANYSVNADKTVITNADGTSIVAVAGGAGSLNIPGTVTKIENGSFFNLTNLSSITIPTSVTEIQDYAFRGCSALSSINYEGTKEQWNNAGKGAYWLTGAASNSVVHCSDGDVVTSVTQGLWFAINATNDGYILKGQGSAPSAETLIIPNRVNNMPVTEIGDYAFTDKASFSTVIIPNTVTKIGNSFSGSTTLSSVTIPNSVKSIAAYAFSYCKLLSSIVIPDSVTSIGRCAFCNCAGLTSIAIPASVTSIGDCAFSYCTGLTSVTISDSVTTIGDYAFSYCTGLTSVTIPSSVTSIGEYAFSGCTGLTSVTIPSSVKRSIGDYAFSRLHRL
jgi:hypothetical protein